MTEFSIKQHGGVVAAIILVRFDLEFGQSIAAIQPLKAFGEEDLKLIGFHAFPVSQLSRF